MPGKASKPTSKSKKQPAAAKLEAKPTSSKSITNVMAEVDAAAEDGVVLSPEMEAQIIEEFGEKKGKKGKKDKADSGKSKTGIKIPAADPNSVTVAALKKEVGSIDLSEGQAIQNRRRVYSTGCVGLDVATGKIDPIKGNGGIPELTIMELYGPPGVRKSNTCEELAYNILMDDPNNIVLFLYTEDPDLSDMRFKKFPRDRFQIIGLYDPATPEARQKSAEVALMDLVEASKYSNVKMICIDSLKALISITQVYKKGVKTETIKPIEEDEVAIRARLMEKLFNRMLFQRRSAILAMTNQVADRIPNRNDRFVIGLNEQDKTPAGRMKEFLSVLRINVNGKPLYDAEKLKIAGGEKDSEQNPQAGILEIYKIKKNRWGRPNIKVVVPFDFELGYDTSLEVLQLGVSCGVIKKSGSNYQFKDGTPNGKEAALQYLDEHKEERDELTKAIVKAGPGAVYGHNRGDERAPTKAVKTDEETGEVTTEEQAEVA